jgi:Spy/CpxP family protein refolding chaperone
MRSWFCSLAALGLIVSVLPTTLAQPPRGGPGMMGGPGALVNNSGVQKELNLTEEQIQKSRDVLQKVREKHQDEFEKMRDMDPEERREKGQQLMKAVGDEMIKELSDVLSADQIKRLKQIGLQQRGPQAFLDPEVEKSLKLTDDQKRAIKTIADDAGREMREVFQNAQGNFQEAMQKVGAMRKEAMNKVVAVLNDQQKDAWKDLTGKPFEVRFEGRGQRGGGNR